MPVHIASSAGAPSGSTGRALRAARPARGFGPLPLATLVWIEIAVVAALVAFVTTQQVHASVIVLAVSALVAVTAIVLAIPIGGVTVASRIARRLRFRGRRRRPMQRGVTTGVPTRSGHLLGLLSVPPTTQVVVAVGPSRRGMLRVGGGSRIPLADLAHHMRGTGIPHDSFTVILDRPGALRSADRVLIIARVDPLAAREAVTVRGGGTAGLAATLSALGGHIVAALDEAGLAADLLGPDEVTALEEDAAEFVGVDGASEGWRTLTTARGTHRLLALVGLGQQAHLARVPLGPGAGLALRVRVDDSDTVRVRAIVRVASDQPSAAATAAGAAAATPGVALRAAAGLQRHGLLDATVLGSPEPMGPTAEPWPDRWPVLELDGRELDRLAPLVRSGAVIGSAAEGDPVHLDVEGAHTRTVALLGEGWLATSLVTQLVAQGHRIVVATTRPAPWRAVSRQVGPDLVVVDAVAGESLPRAVADIVVDDIAAPLDPSVDLGLRRPGRTLFVVRPTGDADVSLWHSCDLILATASGLPAADGRTDLLGLPAVHWGAHLPAQGEFLAVEPGGAVVVRPLPATSP